MMAFWALIAGLTLGVAALIAACVAQQEVLRARTSVEPSRDKPIAAVAVVLLALALICAFAAGGM